MKIKFNLLNKPITWDRIKKAYVLFTLRQNRGAGYFGKIQSYVILGASIKLLFGLPNILIVPLLLVYFILTYYVGLFDYKFAKIWQLEQEMSALYANPFNQRQEKMFRMLKNGRNKN